MRSNFPAMPRFLLGAILVVAGSMAMPADRAAAQFPLPKPGLEHDYLKAMEGTWDATVKTGDSESKGVAVYKMELGGLWLTSRFEGSFADQKFEGRGLDTFDPLRKKYISVWVDSMSTSPVMFEGELDQSGKILTMTGEGSDFDGTMHKMKAITETKDANTMVFTMMVADENNQYQTVMTITYKRRK